MMLVALKQLDEDELAGAPVIIEVGHLRTCTHFCVWIVSRRWRERFAF
jgi:hypothetical protein